MIGVLTVLHISASAVAMADQPAQVLTYQTARGPRDITTLLSGIQQPKKPGPPPCTIVAWSQPYAKVMIFGGAKAVSTKGACTWTDVKQWEARMARFVREHLGDPGRH